MPAKKKTTISSKNVLQSTKEIQVKRALAPFALVAFILLILDVVYHQQFEIVIWRDVWFYAWFSILSCTLWVAAAYALRFFTKRTEKYYRREAEQA